MSEDTMFNPDDFMNTAVEGELSTEYSPVPENEYIAVVEEVKPDTTPSGTPLLGVFWKIDAPGDDEADGRVVRQTIWLDVTGEGALDRGKGKNVQLGRLRAALNQNGPGAWNPGMLLGAVARISIKHSADKDNPDRIYANVNGVVKAA